MVVTTVDDCLVIDGGRGAGVIVKPDVCLFGVLLQNVRGILRPVRCRPPVCVLAETHAPCPVQLRGGKLCLPSVQMGIQGGAASRQSDRHRHR